MSESESQPEGHGGANLLLIGIISGVVLGALAGGYSPGFGLHVQFIGEVFLNALMCMVVPLVVASMIMGIAALGDVRKLGGIGLKTIVYYTLTTGVAVVVGLVAVNLVKPGEGVSIGEDVKEATWTNDGQTLTITSGRLHRTNYDDRFRVVVTVPGSAGKPVTFHAHVDKERKDELTETTIPVEGWTQVGEDDEVDDAALSSMPAIAGLSGTTVPQLEKRIRQLEAATGTANAGPPSGTGVKLEPAPKEKVKEKEIAEVVEEVIVGLVPKNLVMSMAETKVLPIIIFALLFGAVLTTLGARGKHVIDFFDGTNEAIMVIVQILMYTAPVGIFALVAGRLGEAGGFAGFLPELKQLGWYAATVVGGLGFHACVVLPAILYFVGKRNPLAYARGMFTALTTAFSTSSSAATLPLTLRGVEANGVSERTASFVCPLGATINMDGTAMYEAVAALFIAQAYGVELTFVHQIVIFLTATLAAIGAAGIPEAGLVTMVIVLNAVGLPVEGTVLILVIDWLLDRCRTTINVWGDSVGAAVIDQLENGTATADPVAAGF